MSTDEHTVSLLQTAAPESLADLVVARLHERAGLKALRDPSVLTTPEPRVVKVYKGVAGFLQRYKSGKFPRAFKVLPSLAHWEQLLVITQPDNWTPAALEHATRIFVSNLNEQLAQRFLYLVVLPRFREDIRCNKKLHPTLFVTLQVALYKPAAFFKGILLPLCRGNNCSLREAVILSAIIQRKSIPAVHSCAALLRIAEMKWTGVNSFFLRVLIDKKYALPLRVVDALAKHFTSFINDQRELPVVWHQALLAYVSRYKHHIRPVDRTVLWAVSRRELFIPPVLNLFRQHNHPLMSPVVRKELATVAEPRDLAT